ncbi:hypothetical protein Tco_0592653 [Tanacetum coccineum]
MFVTPWAADAGRRKMVKCYVQGSGRRKRKKGVGRSSGRRGSENEVCLIKFILACSPLLKKIVIKVDQYYLDRRHDSALEMARKLLKLYRASPLVNERSTLDFRRNLNKIVNRYNTFTSTEAKLVENMTDNGVLKWPMGWTGQFPMLTTIQSPNKPYTNSIMSIKAKKTTQVPTMAKICMGYKYAVSRVTKGGIKHQIVRCFHDSLNGGLKSLRSRGFKSIGRSECRGHNISKGRKRLAKLNRPTEDGRVHVVEPRAREALKPTPTESRRRRKAPPLDFQAKPHLEK